MLEGIGGVYVCVCGGGGCLCRDCVCVWMCVRSRCERATGCVSPLSKGLVMWFTISRFCKPLDLGYFVGSVCVCCGCNLQRRISHRVGPIAMYPVNVSGCGFICQDSSRRRDIPEASDFSRHREVCYLEHTSELC